MTRAAPNPNLLSLVVPVYNEVESLPALVAEIAVATKDIGRTVEILFIDDGSNDGSWEVIRDLAAKSNTVQGYRFRRNFGKAAALSAGFKMASGSIIMTLDADLQDDPIEIPRFLAAIQAGADVVCGWKKIRHDPWHKVFPSRIFNGLVSWLTGVTLHDHNCGFKAYRADVIREVKLYGELHRFVPVLAAAEGFRCEELVIHHRARKFGHSKFGARRFLKGFIDLIAVWSRTTFGNRPMHAFGTLAILLAFFGAITWLATMFLPLGSVFGPFVSMLSFLSFILAGQSAFTGISSEMALARSAPDAPYRISETVPARKAIP